jgi:hypothetical protein
MKQLKHETPTFHNRRNRKVRDEAAPGAAHTGFIDPLKPRTLANAVVRIQEGLSSSEASGSTMLPTNRQHFRGNARPLLQADRPIDKNAQSVVGLTRLKPRHCHATEISRQSVDETAI